MGNPTRRNIEAIATYLASLSVPPGNSDLQPVVLADMADATPPGVVIYGTLSPTFRGGSGNLQNPGFFPDTWLGVGVQTSSPLSGRVTSCISCHTEPGEGNRIELVEPAPRLDLIKTAGHSDLPWKSAVEAGDLSCLS